MRTDFVLDALEQALHARQPERDSSLIHPQYVSIRYNESLAEAGIEPSVGSRGDSYDTDPAYPTLMAALLAWRVGGAKPTPAAIAAQCAAFEPRFGPGCHFLPDYVPRPLDTRVAPRERP